MFKKFVSMFLASTMLTSTILTSSIVTTIVLNPIEVSAETVDYKSDSITYVRIDKSELIPASRVDGYKYPSLMSEYIYEVVDTEDDDSDEISDYYIDFCEPDGTSYGWYKLSNSSKYRYHDIACEYTNGMYRVVSIGADLSSIYEYTASKEQWDKLIDSAKNKSEEGNEDGLDIGVRKHISKKSVTLSSAENAGTLVVNSVDAKTLSKLDKMLNLEKKLTLKIKAKKESEAKSKLNKLKSDIGHINEMGVTFYLNRQKDLRYDTFPMYYKDKVSLKKSGKYYVATVTKNEATAYKYSVKTVEKHCKKNSSILKKGVHPCDCSDQFKIALAYAQDWRSYSDGDNKPSNAGEWYKYCYNETIGGFGSSCNLYMVCMLNSGAMFGITPYINEIADVGCEAE